MSCLCPFSDPHAPHATVRRPATLSLNRHHLQEDGFMKILIAPKGHIWPEVTPEERARLMHAGATEVYVTSDHDELLQQMPYADVFIGDLDPELFEVAPRLRWLQSLSSGVDHLLFPAFVESDVVLTSEKGLVGPHLADHAFGLLLALTRSLAWAARQRRWDNRFEMRRNNCELTGLTMGIIGLGGTGTEVARRASAFGMRALAIDPDVTERPPFVDALSTPERLTEMAGQSNVLVVCCPLTRATRNMVDDAVLNAMPERSYVINVTRGGIIDEDALARALESGHLAGAGLDVAASEPMADDHPLWAFDNVIISPHTAGASQHRVGRLVDRIIRNVEHLSNDQPLEGVVDKEKGY